MRAWAAWEDGRRSQISAGEPKLQLAPFRARCSSRPELLYQLLPAAHPSKRAQDSSPISTRLEYICVDPNGQSGKATLVIGEKACEGKTRPQVYVPTT